MDATILTQSKQWSLNLRIKSNKSNKLYRPKNRISLDNQDTFKLVRLLMLPKGFPRWNMDAPIAIISKIMAVKGIKVEFKTCELESLIDKAVDTMVNPTAAWPSTVNKIKGISLIFMAITPDNPWDGW